MAWLLRDLPPQVQAALTPDLLTLKRTRPCLGRLPTEQYTWPDVPGVRRPRYDGGALKRKPLEGLRARLHDEFSLGLVALCASQECLSRTMRNALLAVQGQRLGQVSAALEQYLKPGEVLALFQQELAAQ